jgi:MbtH protein
MEDIMSQIIDDEKKIEIEIEIEEVGKTVTGEEVASEEKAEGEKKAEIEMREDEDDTIYRVVVNEEEQYSIWPEYKKIPLGWREAGKIGKKRECLAFVKEVWTDMRPLSLRKQMEEAERRRAQETKQQRTN